MRRYVEALWGGWVRSSTPESLPLEGHEMIECSGESVGCVACEWQANHLRIGKLYVSPQYRRREDQNFSRDLTLRLTVLSTNNNARRLYEREGMSVVERTEECIALEV